jgi:NAD(P)-binding Rossmann-like domain
MNHPFSRRTFLKASVCCGATLAVSPQGFSTQVTPVPKASESKKVVVVGAGMAGLTAGFELMQAGHDVTVLESWRSRLYDTRPVRRRPVCGSRGCRLRSRLHAFAALHSPVGFANG